MTQAHDRQTAFDPLGLGAVVTPALILLRAELMALEQMLPGHAAPQARDDATAFEAETDNMPV